jgi:hypothetical protein
VGKRVGDEDLTRVKAWSDQFPQTLFPADLSGTFFDTATSLEDVALGNAEYGRVSVVGARWGGVDLSAVE